MSGTVGTDNGRHLAASLSSILVELSSPEDPPTMTDPISAGVDPEAAVRSETMSVGAPVIPASANTASNIETLGAATAPEVEPAGVLEEPLMASTEPFDLPTSSLGDLPDLSDFDPTKYLSTSADARAVTTEEIPMASASGDDQASDSEGAAVGYEPQSLTEPGRPRDSRSVLAMLHELSALRDNS